MEITIKRTAAATAVAAKVPRPAKFISRDDLRLWRASPCATSRACLMLPLTKSLRIRYRFKRIVAISLHNYRANLPIDIEAIRSLPGAIRSSDVVVTCTPATEFSCTKKTLLPGRLSRLSVRMILTKTKSIPPCLSSAKVVADSLEQVCSIGDTHHAIAQCLMRERRCLRGAF